MAPVLEPIEHSVLEKPLEGGPMEGMAVLEPLEHSVLMTKRIDVPVEGAPVLEPIEHMVLEKPLDGEHMEGAPVLEPIEHSVLEKPLDGGPMKEMSVLEPLEHSVLLMAQTDGPMEGASVLEKPLDGGPLVKTSILGPLQSSVPDVAPVWGDCSLFEMTVSDPLDHLGLNVTVHVDVDSFWLAPWDAGGTLSSDYRPGLAVWRAVLCSVARLSRRPVLSAMGFWRSFGDLGRTCVMDLDAGSREPLRIFWEMTLR